MIAAGFVCKNGVLLCTDTQHTAWPMKFDSVKGEEFDTRQHGVSRFSRSHILPQTGLTPRSAICYVAVGKSRAG